MWEFGRGWGVLWDYDQATSFFVQTGDDAGTQLAADLGERAEAVQQSVDQGAAIAVGVGGPGAGVDHHSGGFIDDREVWVFIDKVERDFLRDGEEGGALEFTAGLYFFCHA